jgi:hypothetical protein
MEALDREYMVELWVARMLSSTDFERGYYQGKFEHHAAQNAIDPDDFPAIQAEARDKLTAKLEAIPIEVDETLLTESVLVVWAR